MKNIFEELMATQSALTEGVNRKSRTTKKTESKKKIPTKNIKVESFKIFEEEDLDDLNAQFDVTPDEVEDTENDAEVVLVIDPELPVDEEPAEDAAEDMIGDMVYKCPVCGANYVCDCDAVNNESIEVDENGEPTACPICNDDSEQILIGEIAPVEDAGEEVDEKPVAPETDVEPDEETDETEDVVSEEEEEVIEDSYKRRPYRRTESKRINESDKMAQWLSWLGGQSGSYSDDALQDTKSKKGELKKVYKQWSKGKPDGEDNSTWIKSLGDQVASILSEGIDDLQAKVDKDVKKHGKPSLKTVKAVNAAGYNVYKTGPNQHTVGESIREDFEVEDGETCEDCLDLDIDNAILPETSVGDAPKVEVEADVVNINLDEKKLESLLNKMIRENYKNVPSLRVTKASYKGNRLKIEYVVRERGNKAQSKGTLVAEGFSTKSRKMVLRAKDKGVFTESFTKRPAFIIECVTIRNTVIPISLKYNFTKKVNESLYRVYGSVGQSSAPKKPMVESKRTIGKRPTPRKRTSR